MKITISQKVLSEALKRGALAALSDEAQADSSTLSRLIKSVKIKADNDSITFESATALIASRYVSPLSEDATVKEVGNVMVPAKELYEWVNRQGDCIIALRSKDLDSPELISVSSGNMDSLSKASIKKTGTLDLLSKDSSKTGSKWSLDSYDSDQVPLIDYDFENKSLFELPLEQLEEGLKYVSFVAMPKDADHLFDTVSFQHKDGKMYLVTTDCARCSLYHIPNADNITLKSTITSKQMEESGMNNAWEHNILINCKILSNICKLSSDVSPLKFYRDEHKNRAYIYQPGFIVRLATAEKGMIEKYPPLDLFLNKKYTELCKIPVNVLTSRLNTVSIVNKSAILFDFKGDKLTLTGMSESGQSPCMANVDVQVLNEELKRVWNVQHFLDVLKVIGSEIKLLIPTDKNKDSIKILSPEKSNVEYYAMAVERSKYNLND